MSHVQADLKKAKEEFVQALEEMWKMSQDFTPGSQQRWTKASRKVNSHRNHVWYLEQRICLDRQMDQEQNQNEKP